MEKNKIYKKYDEAPGQQIVGKQMIYKIKSLTSNHQGINNFIHGLLIAQQNPLM